MRRMALCCPHARGCNAAERSEPCLLDLCRRAARELPEAALALARWEDWQRARERGCRRSEWRFRKRAYERARAEALGGLLMYAHATPRPGARRRARASDAAGAAERRATTRLGILLSQSRGGARRWAPESP